MRHPKKRSEESKRKKSIAWSILIAIGVSLFLAGAAGAQTKSDIERELEKTDAVVERAADAVSENRNPKAEYLLEMARELQGEAEKHFRMMRYRMALGLTLNARKRAYEAIGFTKKDEENENLVWKAIERTDQIIGRAKEAAGEVDQGRSPSLLEMADGNQQKSKEFFRVRRLKAALKLTREAREIAEKVLNLVSDGQRLNRLAQGELATTDKLIEKASVIIGESQIQKADQLLDQARSSQKKAWDMFNQKSFKKATKNTQKARELAQEALRLVEEDVRPQMVNEVIQQNERLIEEGVEKMKASANPDAQSTFEKGISHHNKAKEYYHRGKFKAALAEAKAAIRLMTKALEMARGNGF